MVKGSLVLAVVLSSFAFACTVSAPAGQDLFSTSPATPAPTPSPSPTTPSPEPLPCSDDVGCEGAESAFDTITECTSSGAELCRRVTPRCGGVAYYCGTPAGTCMAIPTCQSGEIEVTKCGSGASCIVRSECGKSIICQKQIANCDAYPSCDPGDVETKDLSDCKQANVDCYSRTVCGSTITCINVK